MAFLKMLCAFWVGVVCLACGVYWGIPDPLPKVIEWPVSPVLLDSRGDLIHARLSSAEEWCLPIPLEEMGQWLPKVAVAIEDKRFFAHRGIDALSLARAAGQNIARGRVVSGASTITSQLIRLSEPRSRTAFTKVQEFLAAWKLETRLGKHQILELYLNRAPFGGPIRGVEAASRLYFGKRARDLSLGEASLLIGLLKGPTAYRPDRNPKRALARRQYIIQKVALETGLPTDRLELALKEPLPRFQAAMPMDAWHFAELAFRAEFGPAYPKGAPYFVSPQPAMEEAGHSRVGRLYSAGILKSTLDTSLQRLLEQALNRQLSSVNPAITAAGIIVENHTGAILAYVGNARFHPGNGVEWVDCALAPRSPGSTLKPFLYLKVMEEGRLIPASLLADSPLNLSGQAPRNFNRVYLGPVSAHFALAHSLNAPAVRVQRILGVQAALRILKAAGFSHFQRPESYGDSLILGAGEVTLLELARAYTTLATLGLDKPLTYAYKTSAEHNTHKQTHKLPSGLGLPMDPAKVKETRLHSKAASYFIADILSDPGRLPFVTQLTQAREERPIAFKTGTSFGLRDAWCAAYFPVYTVVVWFGQANGGGNNKLVGISMAAPAALSVARDLGRALPVTQSATRWYQRPESVSMAQVCSLSGAAPSPYCPSLQYAQVITGIFRTTPCSMHVSQFGRISVLWPPELEDFTQRREVEQDMSRPVLITSPMPATEYLITPGVQNQPIPLKAEGVTYPVFWFVGSEFIGEQQSVDKPLYWLPVPGNHAVSLSDAQEKTSQAEVIVTDLARQAENSRLKPLF